ncbi:hypothetical protein [Roseomonas gilardii]|uniref:hypothetical protein n=1 Tax=Roseomonas gilardii TaxID=257708 RepID=UPI0031F5D7B1
MRFRQLLETFGSGSAALEALPRWPARREGGRFEPPPPMRSGGNTMRCGRRAAVSCTGRRKAIPNSCS